jgi:hypothetical protein
VYAYYAIRDTVKERLEANRNARVLVTGHGSGGALAVLFSAVLAYHKEKAVLDRLAGVYTFGQPRVGDAMLAMFVERNLDRPRKRHFRITYGDDPLPRLPDESSPVHFLHFGLGVHYNRSYKLKVNDPCRPPFFYWKKCQKALFHRCSVPYYPRNRANAAGLVSLRRTERTGERSIIQRTLIESELFVQLLDKMQTRDMLETNRGAQILVE